MILNSFDDILSAYVRQVNLPWANDTPPAGRIWVVWYEKALQRRFTGRLSEFEHATQKAGHGWRHLDLAPWFGRWIAEHEFFDGLIQQPKELRGLLPDIEDSLIAQVRENLATCSSNDVLAVDGCGALFGVARVAVVPDEDLEWAVRLALEVRRRVKEQQKRIGSTEFRNTQFSYAMGLDGVEKFVSTPELQSEDSIGSDPLPAGQVWAISPGGQDESTGLFRIEVTESTGGGVRILNQSPPGPFRESARIAEQNLYARSRELVGERNPREHEFALQLRSFDAAKSGEQLGVGVLVALSSALLGKPLKGGLVIAGGITLGGTIEPVHNPIDVVELAMEKGANAVLVPVSSRRALIDLSDDVATKVQVLFYSDAPDALRKALHD